MKVWRARVVYRHGIRRALRPDWAATARNTITSRRRRALDHSQYGNQFCIGRKSIRRSVFFSSTLISTICIGRVERIRIQIFILFYWVKPRFSANWLLPCVHCIFSFHYCNVNELSYSVRWKVQPDSEAARLPLERREKPRQHRQVSICHRSSRGYHQFYWCRWKARNRWKKCKCIFGCRREASRKYRFYLRLMRIFTTYYAIDSQHKLHVRIEYFVCDACPGGWMIRHS